MMIWWWWFRRNKEKISIEKDVFNELS